jgi:antitoxin ParD1/3/4
VPWRRWRWRLRKCGFLRRRRWGGKHYRAIIDNYRVFDSVWCMAQMNISIPEKLKAYVESRVADGDYASSSDYLRDLVRQEQRYREQLERLRAEIQAGYDSGISERSLDDIIEDTRKKYQQRDAA